MTVAVWEADLEGIEGDAEGWMGDLVDPVPPLEEDVEGDEGDTVSPRSILSEEAGA